LTKNGNVPLLVTVTTCGALAVPARWLPKFKLAGESVASGMTPVPVKLEVLLTVPETVSDAVCVPVERGTKATLMVQLVFTAKLGGQLFVWLKSPVTATPEIVNDRSPVLV